MTKLIASLVLFLALAAGIAIGRSWRSEPAAAAPLPVAIANGDTNGDGERDISDAIYLLRWLFSTGAEPVPFAADCPPRFVDNGDGTVTDTATELDWQKGALDLMSRPDAEAAASTLDLGGHLDWRLPTQAELSSIVDITRMDPSIDPVFEGPSGAYWVASTNAGDPCHGASLAINFSYGGFVTLMGSPLFPASVRLVRGSAWPRN